MRRESYLSQPSAVEVYPVFSGTDVIMRKNIELADKEDIRDGKKNKYKVWECEEVQYRRTGIVTKEEVEERFDYFWAIAEGKTDQEATDEAAVIAGEPTLLERLETLEGAFLEFVEVMSNG